MKLLKYIFFPNWITLELFTSVYKTELMFQSQFGQIVEIPNSNKEETFVCEVQYSRVRDSYRIKQSGFIPADSKASEAYRDAIMFIKEKTTSLTEIRNKLNNQN
jgi:hypothetical protein